ncbi:MAG: sigma-54-dependent Fis family transcriptional regulator [Pseudobdellovibrionaceae bacterium]|nr:MAG: sigma-54-dependent Fis family transcriptional regulator [Pseudobdellovibrionaceae bacterium]
MRHLLLISSVTEPWSPLDEDLGPGYQITRVSSLNAAQSLLREKRFDMAFIELALLQAGPVQGVETFKNTLNELLAPHVETPTVIITPDHLVPFAVELASETVSGYLTLPVEASELKLMADRLFESRLKEAEIRYLRDQFWSQDYDNVVATTCPQMKIVLDRVQDVAPTKSTVLLNGETGVGKSLFAQLIHQHSSRKNKQFIKVHCGAISESLIESELFGHEKGAFTGALRRKLGKFELAHGGTIFLDEISTLSPSAQIKLLQVIQDSTFQRVGGETDVEVDIRIIVATNENLKLLSDEKKFRQDLYYRLNVFPISIPPLRNRMADLPTIMQSLIEKLNRTHQKHIIGADPEALNALMSYLWPGNVRELENVIERAYILERSKKISLQNLPLEIAQVDQSSTVLPIDTTLPLAEARQKLVSQFERAYLQELLTSTHGKINKAAETAGISTRQLNKLMNRYKLATKDFKWSKLSPSPAANFES